MGILSALTPVGWAGAGISLAGQIFGAVKSARANKANQALLNQEMEQNKADYNNNANKDFLQTNVAKDANKQMQEGLQDAQKDVAGRGAITGATDEAKLAGNDNARRTYIDGVSRLASQGTSYQNQQDAMYRQNRSLLNQRQMQINNQKSQSATNLGANAGELFNTVAGGSMLDTSKDKPQS